MGDLETLSIEEAAALTRLGVESMRELIERGEVPALQLNRKHTVLLREDVIDYIRITARKQAEERKKADVRKPSTRRRGSDKPDLARYAG